VHNDVASADDLAIDVTILRSTAKVRTFVSTR
jgi:hypothetical protein